MHPPEDGIVDQAHKGRIGRIIRRIPEAAMDPECGAHNPALRDLYRKLVAYRWTDAELSVLEKEVFAEIERVKDEEEE